MLVLVIISIFIFMTFILFIKLHMNLINYLLLIFISLALYILKIYHLNFMYDQILLLLLILMHHYGYHKFLHFYLLQLINLYVNYLKILQFIFIDKLIIFVFHRHAFYYLLNIWHLIDKLLVDI